MAVYWNILIWSFFIASLWRLFPRESSLAEGGEPAKRANLLIACLAFGIIIFFAGLRSGIADTNTYIFFYENLPADFLEGIFSDTSRDKGFTLFSYLIKKFISEDFQLWLFIIALISGLAVMAPLYKYSPMFELSTFLFVATAQFTWLLNGMRQFIAISLLFLSLNLLLQKSYKTYILLVLLLSTIHGSAIIMLPFCLLCQSKPWSKQMVTIIVVFFIVFFFIKDLLFFGDDILESTQYAGYTNMIAEIRGSSIFRLIAAGIPLLLTLWKKRKVAEFNNKLLNICINMSAFNFCFMLLSTAIGGIFIGRVAAYFDIYNLLLYPLILTELYQKQERTLLYAGIILGYTTWFYFQMAVVWDSYYISDVLDLYIN